MPPAVRVFPRRKALHGALLFYKGSRGVNLKLSTIQALFHLPQTKAAASLGLSLTAFKSARRRLGISRWPYERKASGDKKIAAAQRKPRRGRDSGRTGTGGRQDEDVEDGTGPLDPEWITWYMTTSEDGGLS
ncbi:RWP-RK domain-containing protein [Guillardia theta CCMP2712]|uniref:RWP-RK domain-containing protein n=1 Tax=Guillardia theta (strain CCMP2712) TaxID=905079 RepID=L1J9Y0_GUITC|nr:RWP-RK domain-containing protein [Guillardia theta CCMP2712]EKX44895.1 RWP-RK domain-containing protein [Guillardia theta CCMP2712]|eukprot:XP_005831875.1 RWP-RK domain-containing protein [Guillardia theta CCMP2712]